MLWFKKKKTPAQLQVDGGADPIHAIQIVTHKDANKKVVAEAEAANAKLKQLFDENGFTVKIVLAMGAKQQHREGK